MEFIVQILLTAVGALLVLSMVLTRMYNEVKKEYEDLISEIEEKIESYKKSLSKLKPSDLVMEDYYDTKLQELKSLLSEETKKEDI